MWPFEAIRSRNAGRPGSSPSASQDGHLANSPTSGLLEACIREVPMTESKAPGDSRRLWIVGGLVGLLLAATACGSPSTAISGAPPTATSVANAIKNSSMKNAHFTVQGSLASGGKGLATTGDGTLQIKPTFALQINFKIQTALGTTGLDVIVVDNIEYSRTGTGAWTSQPDPTAASLIAPDKYIGEESLNGAKTWHVQWHGQLGTYDDWVREADGYLMKVTYAATAGSKYTLTFDSYNTGTGIVAPASPTPAS